MYKSSIIHLYFKYGALAPHTNGNLYAAKGTQLLIISQPDAAEPGFDNLQLQGAAHSNNNLLAYATKKNFVFSPSIATFARTVSRRQYEQCQDWLKHFEALDEYNRRYKN